MKAFCPLSHGPKCEISAMWCGWGRHISIPGNKANALRGHQGSSCHEWCQGAHAHRTINTSVISICLHTSSQLTRYVIWANLNIWGASLNGCDSSGGTDMLIAVTRKILVITTEESSSQLHRCPTH